MAKRTTQSAIFKKANQLMREGMGRPQAFKVAYSELGEPVRKTARKAVRKNPIKKSSILWRYNKITGYWESERSCITGATCEDWLHEYKKDEPNELFKVAVNRPKNLTVTEKDFLSSRAMRKNPTKRKTRATTQKTTITRARPTTTIKLFSNPRSTYTDYIVSESANGKTGWKAVATFLHEKNAVEYAHALEHKNAIEKRSRYIQITTQLHELRRKLAA